MADDVGNWTEPLGVVSVAFETLLGALILVRHRRGIVPRADRRWVPAAVSVLLLTGGMVATSRSADAQDTPHGHAGMPVGRATSGDGYWSDVAGATVPIGGHTRTYYVSADPVVWDYTPARATW